MFKFTFVLTAIFGGFSEPNVNVLGSHGTGRIFDWLKNLIGHFVHMGPFNIFVLFTRGALKD